MNLQLLGQYWRILKPYWHSQQKITGFGYLALILVAICLEILTNVAINRWMNAFYNAIQAIDHSGLFHLVCVFFGLIFMVVICATAADYFAQRLSLSWRQYLTHYYLDSWHEKTTPDVDIDNPDQRLTEDIWEATSKSLELGCILVRNIISFVTFCWILWNLSGVLTLSIANIGDFKIHGVLLWSTLFYVLCGSWLMLIIGRPLSHYRYNDQERRADFRYALINSRETQQYCQSKLGQLFQPIYDNCCNIIKTQRNINILRLSWVRISFLFGILIAFLRDDPSHLQLGDLMQISSAVYKVEEALGIILFHYPLLAQLNAALRRLNEYGMQINRVNSIAPDPQAE